MKNNSFDAQIIAQIESVAQDVFRQYSDFVAPYIPSGSITLTELQNKQLWRRCTVASIIKQECQKQTEKKMQYRPEAPNKYTWIVDDRYRNSVRAYKEWLEKSGALVQIQGDGYAFSFPRWEAFEVLERYAKLCRCTPSIKVFQVAA